MDAEALKEFVRRDRASVAGLKKQHWAQLWRQRGGRETFRIGQILRAHACRVRPDWPTERDRDEDLAAHIEMKRRFEQVADAFSRR